MKCTLVPRRFATEKRRAGALTWQSAVAPIVSVALRPQSAPRTRLGALRDVKAHHAPRPCHSAVPERTGTCRHGALPAQSDTHTFATSLCSVRAHCHCRRPGFVSLERHAHLCQVALHSESALAIAATALCQLRATRALLPRRFAVLERTATTLGTTSEAL